MMRHEVVALLAGSCQAAWGFAQGELGTLMEASTWMRSPWLSLEQARA